MFEMAIVILIAAVLAAGIIQGSKLIKRSRLAAAQTLTQNSPANDTEGMLLWYETSLTSSFLDSEAQNNTSVSTWYDNNPKAMTRLNATQNTATNKPLFIEEVFYGAIPAIRFDGNNDYMSFDGSGLTGNSYTIFIVEQRRAAVSGGDNAFLAGTSSVTNANLHLLYRTNTTIHFGQYNNDISSSVPAYGSPTPRIHTFNLNTSYGKRYWLNGGDNPDAFDNAVGQRATLIAFSGSALGRYLSGYFNGDIAEVILFNRSLKTEERQLIEIYLSKKYNITIS